VGHLAVAACSGSIDVSRIAFRSAWRRWDLVGAVLDLIDDSTGRHRPVRVSQKKVISMLASPRTPTDWSQYHGEQYCPNVGRLLKVAQEDANPRGDFAALLLPRAIHSWKFAGPLDKHMHNIKMFDGKGSVTLVDFEASGTDCLPEYKQ
jgi:hypothetical protein